MGSLSVSNCRGLFHWQGLLVVVLLLTFWSPPSTATVEVVSAFVTKGDDVLMKIKNKPPGIVGVVWYKGFGVDHNNLIAFYITKPHFHLSGPDYNGEQMITDDGSLLLKNVTEKDIGAYTVVVHLPNSETQTGAGQLDVYGKEDQIRLIKYYEKKRKECEEKGMVDDDCIP